MTSNSFSCFRALRAERRANDLTVAALLRDVTQSAASILSNIVSAAFGWYADYDRRQQRRRHHYRRAMTAVSTKRLSAQAPKATILPVVASPTLANAPFVHFAGTLPNSVTSALHSATPDLPPAHVCAESSRREACLAAS